MIFFLIEKYSARVIKILKVFGIYIYLFIYFSFLERNFIEWRKDDEGSRRVTMDDEMR